MTKTIQEAVTEWKQRFRIGPFNRALGSSAYHLESYILVWIHLIPVIHCRRLISWFEHEKSLRLDPLLGAYKQRYIEKNNK